MNEVDSAMIDADAKRQAMIKTESFAIKTEALDGMTVIGLAQMDAAYSPYLKLLYAELGQLRKENERLKKGIYHFVDVYRHENDSGDRPVKASEFERMDDAVQSLIDAAKEQK